MEPEYKKMLEESLRLSRENNVILRKLLRSMHMRRIVSIFYWVVIIGSTIGAFYFIQPYIEQLMEVYGGAKSNFEGFNDALQNLKR